MICSKNSYGFEFRFPRSEAVLAFAWQALGPVELVVCACACGQRYALIIYPSILHLTEDSRSLGWDSYTLGPILFLKLDAFSLPLSGYSLCSVSLFRERACKNAKFALQNPIIFGVLASPWTTLKTEKRKFAFSWEMKSVSGHLNQRRDQGFATSWAIKSRCVYSVSVAWCHFCGIMAIRFKWKPTIEEENQNFSVKKKPFLGLVATRSNAVHAHFHYLACSKLQLNSYNSRAWLACSWNTPAAVRNLPPRANIVRKRSHDRAQYRQCNKHIYKEQMVFLTFAGFKAGPPWFEFLVILTFWNQSIRSRDASSVKIS